MSATIASFDSSVGEKTLLRPVASRRAADQDEQIPLEAVLPLKKRKTRHEKAVLAPPTTLRRQVACHWSPSTFTLGIVKSIHSLEPSPFYDDWYSDTSSNVPPAVSAFSKVASCGTSKSTFLPSTFFSSIKTSPCVRTSRDQSQNHEEEDDEVVHSQRYAVENGTTTTRGSCPPAITPSPLPHLFSQNIIASSSQNGPAVTFARSLLLFRGGKNLAREDYSSSSSTETE